MKKNPIRQLVLCVLLFPLASWAINPETVLEKFTKLKKQQLDKNAKALKLEKPQAFITYFDLAEKGDWKGANDFFESFRLKSGQYADASQIDSSIATPLWQSALETDGMIDQFLIWHPKNLKAYGKEMLETIPDDSIYFGGTDPGRFVVTAYQTTKKKRAFYVITQNALADKNYMAYLREWHREAIRIPNEQDVQNAFKEYADKIQEEDGEDASRITMKDGKIRVQGVAAVMRVNGILARRIFEDNKDERDLYVEESYVIPWMYPYLEPHGLIMKLTPKAAKEIDPKAVERDRAFWKARVAALMAKKTFTHDNVARRTYAKLRCAIAGLYQYRRLYEESEEAFRQALELHPTSAEVNYRLADLYMNLERFGDAEKVMQTYVDGTKDNEKGKRFLKQIQGHRAAQTI